jgi:uncharacterized membrane protein (UPF0127 family)
MQVLRNATNGRVLATKVKRATNPLTRGVGLLARARVEPDEGLWIDNCSAVDGHARHARSVLPG